MGNLNYLSFVVFRMCKALLPGDDDSMSDEAIWETLPVSFQLLDSIGVHHEC